MESDSKLEIQKFKSTAWNSVQAAERYARSVNNRTGLPNIDIRTQLELLEKYVQPGAELIDVGAGTGALSLPLAELGYEVTALDLSGSMLAELKKRDKTRTISTLETDIFDPRDKLPKKQFHAAVSRWVIPHFPDWPRILDLVGNALRPNGYFIFDFPHREHVEYALEKFDINFEEFGYDHVNETGQVNPAFYYAAETTSSLREKLANSGFELVERVPYGLLKSNLLIFGRLGTEKTRKLNRLLGVGIRWLPLVRELLETLEREVVAHLQPALVHGSFVVCRKT